MQENLIEKYLRDHKINMSDFARLIDASPTSVCHWKSGKLTPGRAMAWQMHKKTNGEILSLHGDLLWSTERSRSFPEE